MKMSNGFIDSIKISNFNNSQLLKYSFSKAAADPFLKNWQKVKYPDIYEKIYLKKFFSY